MTSNTPPHEAFETEATVLIVDDNPNNLGVLVDTLEGQDYDIIVATSGEQALERCAQTHPDLILLDVMMPGIDGFETCRRLRQHPETAQIPVLFMTALDDTKDKLYGFEVGGVDYITKPIQYAEALARIQTHIQLRRLTQNLEAQVAERTHDLKEALNTIKTLHEQLQEENTRLRNELRTHAPYGDIIGHSHSMHTLTRHIEVVAGTDATVLITGESGTGKELVAREVHRRSERAEHEMIKVNCAAIPKELYESEFFGHVKGAFTGALRTRQGRFQAAHQSTLFLDEVGEIPLDLQPKLLRVLQEGTFEKIGDNRTVHVDIRLVAATNRNLLDEIKKGTFREDLYYRLNVFPIPVPPLRHRIDDVPLLAQHFLERTCARFNLSKVFPLTTQHLHQLQKHTWPGNIRELENTIERAVIHARLTGALDFSSLASLTDTPTAFSSSAALPSLRSADREDEILSERDLTEIIRQNTLRALEHTKWRIRGQHGAAKILGLKPTTLASRMKRMNLQKPRQ